MHLELEKQNSATELVFQLQFGCLFEITFAV
jgi:hypothetical protein